MNETNRARQSALAVRSVDAIMSQQTTLYVMQCLVGLVIVVAAN